MQHACMYPTIYPSIQHLCIQLFIICYPSIIHHLFIHLVVCMYASIHPVSMQLSIHHPLSIRQLSTIHSSRMHASTHSSSTHASVYPSSIHSPPSSTYPSSVHPPSMYASIQPASQPASKHYLLSIHHDPPTHPLFHYLPCLNIYSKNIKELQLCGWEAVETSWLIGYKGKLHLCPFSYETGSFTSCSLAVTDNNWHTNNPAVSF